MNMQVIILLIKIPIDFLILKIHQHMVLVKKKIYLENVEAALRFLYNYSRELKKVPSN